MATRSRSSRRGREGEDESRYLLVIPGRASANPESRSYHFAHHFEIPDRSTLRTVRNDGEQNMLNFYGREFSSRLLIGSALYPSPAIMQGAIRTSGAQIVTVSLRRGTARGETRDGPWAPVPQTQGTVLPHTAGR